MAGEPEIEIWNTCDLCGDEARITQAPEGYWLSKDLAGNNVILPDTDRPPLPPFWIARCGKYYCPDHTLVFHRIEAEPEKIEEFYVTRGLEGLGKK
ncbi:hypothetical protein LCGC14_2206180 [marine sediment metagenome]|uniref:Uncharacterized protein n=1 Tax=marine sediment metagenome TaxID=412755 RepID=A0A0F9E2K9_9ZZZZ